MAELLSLIKSYASYNLWANNRIAEQLKTISEDEFNAPDQSSFGSIANTVYHIYGAEFLWLERMKGEDKAGFPAKRKGIIIDFLDTFVEKSESISHFAHHTNRDQWTAVIRYTNADLEPTSCLRWQMLLHCVNHSTFHRGQLISSLRNLGYRDFDALDYIYYTHLLEEEDDGI